MLHKQFNKKVSKSKTDTGLETRALASVVRTGERLQYVADVSEDGIYHLP